MNYLEAIVTVLAVEHFVMSIYGIYRSKKSERQSKEFSEHWRMLMKGYNHALNLCNSSLKSLENATNLAQKSWDKLEKKL